MTSCIRRGPGAYFEGRPVKTGSRFAFLTRRCPIVCPAQPDSSHLLILTALLGALSTPVAAQAPAEPQPCSRRQTVSPGSARGVQPSAATLRPRSSSPLRATSATRFTRRSAFSADSFRACRPRKSPLAWPSISRTRSSRRTMRCASVCS